MKTMTDGCILDLDHAHPKFKDKRYELVNDKDSGFKQSLADVYGYNSINYTQSYLGELDEKNVYLYDKQIHSKLESIPINFWTKVPPNFNRKKCSDFSKEDILNNIHETLH